MSEGTLREGPVRTGDECPSCGEQNRQGVTLTGEWPLDVFAAILRTATAPDGQRTSRCTSRS